MIRRRRGPEPPELAQVRSWRVARAILYGTDPAPRDDGWRPARAPTDLGYNIKAVRDALRRAQYGRCAYCATQRVEADHYDLEHYRPRARYWWLTWTWENLWLACNVCQGKSNRFPCQPGTEPLPAPTPVAWEGAFVLSAERPLLLDPAHDAPQHHLTFSEVAGTNGGWFWAGMTERGRETIDLLHLRRSIRQTEYEDLRQHIRRRLEPETRKIATALAAGDAMRARALWDACRVAFLWSDPASSSEADYRVPSWWYLRAFHEREGLAEHEMVMWDFPDHADRLPSDPRSLIDDGLPDALSSEARLHVIYIRGVERAPKAHVGAAIEAVCACGSWVVDALAALLRRRPATVQRHVTPLVKGGRLRAHGEGYVLAGGVDIGLETVPGGGGQDGERAGDPVGAARAAGGGGRAVTPSGR